MSLRKDLRGEGWSEICVMRPDKFYGMFSNAQVQATVGLSPSTLMSLSASAFCLVPCKQSICLPLTDFQYGCRSRYSSSANKYFT
jgi:hypothetical protein